MDLKKEFDLRCKLMFISKNLKLYDKISVIFFISDKYYNGLKIMEMLLATNSQTLQNKTFFSWAKKQILFSHRDWPQQLAETLTIMQNFKLVKYLGFDESELAKKIELKNKLYTSHIKIALYKLCESLKQNETAILIDAISKEYNILDSTESFKNHLECSILDWCVKNIISIDGNMLNLEAILKHVKQFDADNAVLEIKTVLQKVEFNLLSDVNLLQLQKTLEYYKIIDKNNVGLCVIINEKTFVSSDFKQRWGSNKDVERLKEVFTAYGFRVEIHTDVFFETLMDLLQKYAKLIPESDSIFVLVILSHGSENVIYTSDSVPVSMNAIEMIFQGENCQKLIGKPKIFIIQSCQGQMWQKIVETNHDVDESEENEIELDAPDVLGPNQRLKFVGPQKGDSLIAWSTVQGFASFRDKRNGSWYIEELCKELWKLGPVTDLVDILTLVNNNLRSKVYEGQFMVPSLLSSLSCKIQFPYVEENWLKGRQMMLKRLYFEDYFSKCLKKSELSKLQFLQLKGD